MNTVIKILGAIADAWTVYKSLRRTQQRNAVNRDPSDEWMRQFNPDMRRPEADAKQPEGDAGRDNNGQK